MESEDRDIEEDIINPLNSLIEHIIKDKIKNILSTISKLYPTKFKSEFINSEISYIFNHINLNTESNIVKKIKIKKNSKTIQTIQTIQTINRCNARCWSPYIYDRIKLNKVVNISNSFKVDDFKDINIKKFNSQYIIGLQCKKKKVESSEYCKLHKNHLIHGDYNELPSQEICYHFMKDGNYL
jgi:hypothetical protein